MSQPEKITPSYLGPAGQEDGPTLYSALKHQVLAPEYRDDNLRILRAATIFIAGVAFVRSSWSSTLFPAF